MYQGTAWSRAPDTKTVQSGGLLGQVVGRMLVQRAQQECCGRRSRHYLVEDNCLSRHVFPVRTLVGIIVWTQSGTGQRETGEETARAKVGEDLCPHGDIRLSGGIPANRPGRRGGVPTDLDLAGEN